MISSKFRNGCEKAFCLGRRSILCVARLLGFAATLLLSSSPARADSDWNVTSGTWSTGSNWTALVPTSTTNAYIRNGGIATITQTGSCVQLPLPWPAGMEWGD